PAGSSGRRHWEGTCVDMTEPDRLNGRTGNLRGYGVALVIVATVVTAAVYVHQTARHWETPAILASLGLGLACAGWDLCTKRPGWLWSILAQLLLGFSIASALLHGWNIAAHALFLIAGVSFFAFAFVEYARVQRRSQRALEAAMRAQPRRTWERE